MNEVTRIENNDIMGKFVKTENILNDVQNIIEVSQKDAYRAVNTILTQRNWLIGYRIAEEELAGKNRAEYGANIIKKSCLDERQLFHYLLLTLKLELLRASIFLQ